MRNRLFFRLLTGVLLLQLCACAAKQEQPLQLSGEPAAQQQQPVPGTKNTTPALSPEEQKALTAWKTYLVRSGRSTSVPGAFRISATFRYSTPKDSNRVNALLWGNGKKNTPYPLRLDLIAGVGSVVAKIRETAELFTAYVPDENTVYSHQHDSRSLVALGVPVPLALNDLVLLLTGHGHTLLLPRRTGLDSPMPKGYTATADGFLFPVPDAVLPGYLEISPSGVPVAWRQTEGKGWIIGFEADTDHPQRMRKLRISYGEEYSALVLTKEISAMPAPFSADQLNLPLPQNAKSAPLPQPNS